MAFSNSSRFIPATWGHFSQAKGGPGPPAWKKWAKTLSISYRVRRKEGDFCYFLLLRGGKYAPEFQRKAKRSGGSLPLPLFLSRRGERVRRAAEEEEEVKSQYREGEELSKWKGRDPRCEETSSPLPLLLCGMTHISTSEQEETVSTPAPPPPAPKAPEKVAGP